MSDGGPTVALVGCVKTKQAGQHPARDLYTSPLFNGRRRYVESMGMPWFILSALYGLLEPEQIVDSYELPMADLSAAQRREWTAGVIAALEQRIDIPGTTFEFHAGADYSAKSGLATALQERGAVLTLPLHGLSQGHQLRWYRNRVGSLR